MKFLNASFTTLKRAVALAVVMLLFWAGGRQQARAQFNTRWIAIGSTHTAWSQMGMWGATNFPDDASPLWEGFANQSGWGYRMEDKIGIGNIRGQSGGPPPVKQDVEWRGRSEQQYWPKPPFELISKRPATEVLVDGLPSFERVQNIDEVDSNLPADRMLEANYGTWMGVDVRTRIYAYGAEPFDDFYIQELKITNTGNTDQDEEIEEERTLKGFYFSRYAHHAGLPRITGEATFSGYKYGAGIDGARTLEFIDSPDYDVDFTSLFSWAGWQNNFTQWDTRGGPIVKRTDNEVDPWDTTGRLSSGGMIGKVDIYAPERGMGPNETPRNVPDAGDEQPSGTRHQHAAAPSGASADFFGYNSLDTTQHGGHIPLGWWQMERECPREDFPDAQNWEQRMAQCERNSTRGGNRMRMQYGPYTLEPGEHITIVKAIGVAGLSQKAKFEIGHAFKENWQSFQPDAPIEYDANNDGEITNTEIDGAEGDEVLSKNMWTFSSRDSLFQMFKRARQVWKEGELNIPERPVQPARFTVDSRADRVELNWELYADAPVPDSFAIYRTDVNYRLLHHQVATVPASGGERSYTYRDTSVERGVGYYYYLQAIDQTESSPGGVIPSGTTLRSNRYWTQTYTPARLVRGPGEELADTRVVPNPLNVNASTDVRWPQQDTRLGFLDIPEFARIRIYTELGELVETINHTSGSGDEYWNLTTDSNQVVQSGIYLAVIEKMDENGEPTGDQITRRFVIVR